MATTKVKQTRRRRQSSTDVSVASLLKTIHATIPENYTGHSRAQAVGKSVEARYAFLSEKARCAEISKLTKVLAENQKSFDKVIQGVLENQRQMNETFQELMTQLSANSSTKEKTEI